MVMTDSRYDCFIKKNESGPFETESGTKIGIYFEITIVIFKFFHPFEGESVRIS